MIEWKFEGKIERLLRYVFLDISLLHYFSNNKVIVLVYVLCDILF